MSVIIPCKQIDNYTLECISNLKKIEYSDFEIIVLPDESNTIISDVKIISTGNVSPGAKRNIGIKFSYGDYCAFIDSDAFPDPSWLKNALNYFNDKKVGAVGGPGITPPEDSFMRKAGGHVLNSILVGGITNRYGTRKCVESTDIHSCNLVVKKDVLLEIGGWNEQYWPGEDTLLSREIYLKKYKLIEAPDVIVYHHRRPLFSPHIRQISNYGLHRGFFIKKFPDNSLKLLYFAPSLILLMFLSLILASIFSILSNYLVLLLIAGYFTICFFTSLFECKEFNLLMLFAVTFGIILTHIFYGMHFIFGLLSRDLSR